MTFWKRQDYGDSKKKKLLCAEAHSRNITNNNKEQAKQHNSNFPVFSANVISRKLVRHGIVDLVCEVMVPGSLIRLFQVLGDTQEGSAKHS